MENCLVQCTISFKTNSSQVENKINYLFWKMK